MEFDVCLHLHVVAKDGDGWVAKWIKLPFAPFAGLQLWIGEEDLDWERTLYVEEVVWNAHAQDFQLSLAVFDTSEHGEEPFSVWIEKFTSAGWEAST